MRINKLYTLWIIIFSGSVTLYYGIKSIIAHFFGFASRPWVDNMMYTWASKLLKILKVDCKVINPHHIFPQKGHPTIIMCNHSSLYDIPLSIMAFPKYSLRMLAKKELSKIPFLGKAMTATEFPFIDRKHRRQAIKDLQQVDQLLKSGIIMWIAPEGTRSNDGKLAPFKKGGFITAIKSNATIIPLGIRGAFEILPARTSKFSIGKTAELHIGEPIEASQYTLETKEALIAKTHQAIKDLIGES